MDEAEWKGTVSDFKDIGNMDVSGENQSKEEQRVKKKPKRGKVLEK